MTYEYMVGDRIVGTDKAPEGFIGIAGTVTRESSARPYVARVDFDSPSLTDDGKGWLVNDDEIAPLLTRKFIGLPPAPEASPSGTRVCEVPPSARNPLGLASVEAAQIDGTKPTNPKDIIGSRKVPSSVVPQNVLALVACGLSEGMGKYGRHNYRGAGVRASVYYDGNRRHMDAWWEGEDIDADSMLNHVIKAICSNIVLADSILRGNMTDDRPPPSPAGWMAEANEHAARMADKAKAFAEKNGAPHHWTINDEIPS